MDEVELEVLAEKVVEKILQKLDVSSRAVRREFYTIEGAARLVSVTPRVILRALEDGALNASVVNAFNQPTEFRIGREELMRWMKECESGPKPPPGWTPPISRHHLPKNRRLQRPDAD